MKKQTIVIIAAVAACLLVLFGVTKIPSMKIKSEKLPEKAAQQTMEGIGTFEAGS